MISESISVMRKIFQGLRADEDFYNRLSNRWTVILLIVFSLFINMKQYAGSPIICWVPKHFPSSWKKYTNQMCFIEPMYHVPFQERIPDPDLPTPHFTYYIWIPLVLLVQAAMFYVPRAIWRLMCGSAGVNVRSIVLIMEKEENMNNDKRKGNVDLVTRYLERFLMRSRKYKLDCKGYVRRILVGYWCFCVGRAKGNYLFFLFLWCKVLYVLNIIGQMFLLNAFLSTDFHSFGTEIMADIMQWRDWTETMRFPRVILCNLKIRVLGGNIHRHTLQCALPVNYFNERIYLFIWFWFLFLTVATIMGFFVWLSMVFTRERQHFMVNCLKIKGLIKSGYKPHREDIREFVEDYLRMDGAFLLKLMARNTSDIAVADVVCKLFKRFQNRKYNNNFDNDGEGIPMTENEAPGRPNGTYPKLPEHQD
ncbi:innexin unc-9-like [Lingula anatina]|uniref:Innexin n=1 Tax=Lingula anatina TaxID=7574 RepID=A0A1S3H9K7_LINAN|nr:innexin unc-9-like [Lingula anatina]|eukprot:XP_013382693.1 innexin unc-9-like [Lingula anatina]